MTGIVSGGECAQRFVNLAKLKGKASIFPVALLFDVTHCLVYSVLALMLWQINQRMLSP